MNNCWQHAARHTGAVAIPVIALFALATRLWAGGSGLNVVVVVNQNSTNSVQLGNLYCERRQVPPQNLLRMTGWTGGSVEWNRTDFETFLRNPLLAMLAARGLTNQVDFVLLSMDIPYRVADAGSYNSTTAALFYGFKYDVAPPIPCLPTVCSLPDSSSNSYAFSELPFRDATPNTAPTNSFLAVMLTDYTLAGAERVLDRGVASDSSFPTQTVYLAKTSDPARNVRFLEFDNAILESRVRGDNALSWINTDSTAFTNLLGLMTGLAYLSLPPNAFVPGAIGDSLTSYGGILFEGFDQTNLLAFLNAGAAGSYGTVVEPCNYTQKFPHPLDYFYQCRGFCLAEAYYQSLLNPYQGLLVGEPLSAPFARPATASWTSPTNGSVLSGLVPLTLSFNAATTNLPLSQADLFLDGYFIETMANLPPSPGNALSVILNGITVNYTVPTNATLASATLGLASALNALTNSTHVQAYTFGDRLELQSLDLTVPGSNVTLNAGSAPGAAAQLTTLLTPARPTFLDSSATGHLAVLVSNTPIVGDWLQLDFIKTNGAHVTIKVANSNSGTTIGTLARNLLNQINASSTLQSADGVIASDFYDNANYCGLPFAQFVLYARSPGWPSARIQATLTASANLLTLPAGTNRLEDNLYDLRPRNHLYLTAGVSNLPLTFIFDTTTQADGFHELTAVAYEGSHVRTQKGLARNIRIQNGSLAASLTTLVGDTNTALEATLQFSVVANTNNISKIELFSTGGPLTNVTSQPSAIFSVAGTNLGLGLHPFYALVTATNGQQYRTETQWLRLVGADAPFTVSITAPTPRLLWPAAAGRLYDILSTTNFANPFLPLDTIIPSNSTAQWIDTHADAFQRFYRVQSTDP